MGKKIIYLDDAIDAIRALWDGAPTAQPVSAMFDCEDALQALPSAHPEIIYCKHCRKYNKSPKDQEDYCPLYYYRGMSFGDEYDLEFCSYAERRQDEQI